MNRVEWSASRRSLMQLCARKWALKYAGGQVRSGAGRRLSRMGDWRKNWDHMLRTVREVSLERLRDLKRGVILSEIMLFVIVRTNLQNRIDTLNRVFKRFPNRLIEYQEIDASRALKRIEILWTSQPILDIISGRITEWNVQDRLARVKIGKHKAYAAPDIYYRRGRRWRLLRIVTQGSPNPSSGIVMEQNAMVIWAAGTPGFPVSAENFVAENLIWWRGMWRLWTNEPTEDEVSTASNLILFDIRAMEDLWQRLGPAWDISMMPLAQFRSACRGCGFAENCPGGDDLERAKLEQEALERARITMS